MSVIRKESAETHDCVSCQDVEEMGFVPNAVAFRLGGTNPFRIKSMCDQKLKRRGLHLLWTLHPFCWKTMASRTRSTSAGDCYDCRLAEKSNTKVTNAVRKNMIRQRQFRAGQMDSSKERWVQHLFEEATKAVQLETNSSWQTVQIG